MLGSDKFCEPPFEFQYSGSHSALVGQDSASQYLDCGVNFFFSEKSLIDPDEFPQSEFGSGTQRQGCEAKKSWPKTNLKTICQKRKFRTGLEIRYRKWDNSGPKLVGSARPHHSINEGKIVRNEPITGN